MIFLSAVLLGLAALPATLTLVNCLVLGSAERAPAGTAVSILVPARNEEDGIAACVEHALRSMGIELEVIVLDDHSSDRTAAIVGAIAARDERLHLASAPPLPPGWSGKQHACHVLSGLATHPVLIFVDADVRLASEAASRLAGALRAADLVSCVPRQVMGSVGERAIIPMINTLLLGYLPIPLMRRDPRPALGAGCGQLMAMRADAYRRAGGHAGIRHSLHDGLLLPRLFRAAGLRTDLIAGAKLATCRMYVGWRAVLSGTMKNATEGLARPAALPIWTVLLLGGHVLPWLVLLAALVSGDRVAADLAAVACALPLLARVLQSWKCREPMAAIVLHPLGVALLVALQWVALGRALAGRPSTWRGRTYPAQG